MKTVVWLCDTDNWARSTMAEICATHLYEYCHVICAPMTCDAWLQAVKDADIVVCFSIQWFTLLVDSGIPANKIVVRLGSIRLAHKPLNVRLAVWICDCPGWAYDVLAKTYAKHLPTIFHQHVYTAQCSKVSLALHMAEANIIVTMSPRLFSLVDKKYLHKTLLFLDGHRVFEHGHKRTDGR